MSSAGPLAGRTALVTGAATGIGIGAATALAFARAGARVAINHLNQPTSAEAVRAACLAAGADAMCIDADVRSAEQVAAMVLAVERLLGPVDTPMLSLENMSPKVLEAERAIPAERVGRPEEIAAAALFLASDQASFFYGQVLGPNGGAHMA